MSEQEAIKDVEYVSSPRAIKMASQVLHAVYPEVTAIVDRRSDSDVEYEYSSDVRSLQPVVRSLFGGGDMSGFVELEDGKLYLYSMDDAADLAKVLALSQGETPKMVFQRGNAFVFREMDPEEPISRFIGRICGGIRVRAMRKTVLDGVVNVIDIPVFNAEYKQRFEKIDWSKISVSERVGRNVRDAVSALLGYISSPIMLDNIDYHEQRRNWERQFKSKFGELVDFFNITKLSRNSIMGAIYAITAFPGYLKGHRFPPAIVDDANVIRMNIGEQLESGVYDDRWGYMELASKVRVTESLDRVIVRALDFVLDWAEKQQREGKIEV